MAMTMNKKLKRVRGIYHPFFTSSCNNIMYDYNSYTSPHNQSVVTTVIKEVNVRHPSATKDNVKGMVMTCNNPYLVLVVAVLAIKHVSEH